MCYQAPGVRNVGPNANQPIQCRGSVIHTFLPESSRGPGHLPQPRGVSPPRQPATVTLARKEKVTLGTFLACSPYFLVFVTGAVTNWFTALSSPLHQLLCLVTHYKKDGRKEQTFSDFLFCYGRCTTRLYVKLASPKLVFDLH